VVVSPHTNEIIINDPKACVAVQTHYRDWLKPEPLYLVFDIWGTNVLSANTSEWQRHRRSVNSVFREQGYPLVWDESLKQASQMLDVRRVQSGRQCTLEDVRKDCVLVALHVLSGAGFGHTHDFSTGLGEVPQGHIKSLRDDLMFLLTNLLRVLLFGKLWLPKFMMPNYVKELQDTSADFNLYLKEMVSYHKATTQGGGGGARLDASMVSALVEANEAAKREEIAAKTGPKLHLSDDEMYGNLFIFNLAGFETTANALTYTIPFLALHADIQEWVGEEIDAVLQSRTVQDLDYENTFPLLVRCLAIMVSLGEHHMDEYN
jgi:cytochrome P450